MVRFRLKLIKKNTGNIRKQVAVLFDLVCAVQRDAITAGFPVEKEFVIDAVRFALGCHLIARKEQGSNVFEKFVRDVIQFVIESVQKSEFFPFLLKPPNE